MLLMKYSVPSALGIAAMRAASEELRVVTEFSPVTNAATMGALPDGGGADHHRVERFALWVKSMSFGPIPAERAANLGAGAAIGTGAAAAAEDALELAAVARVADLRFLAASCEVERLLSLRLRAAREDAGAGAAMFLKGAQKEG